MIGIFLVSCGRAAAGRRCLWNLVRVARLRGYDLCKQQPTRTFSPERLLPVATDEKKQV